MNTSNWSTDDVSRYLEQIGLGQYSKAFAENDISGNELPFITDDYLIELGITNAEDQDKFIRFRDTIQNGNYDLLFEVDEKDAIHPLSEDANQQVLINESPDHSKSPKVECSICHQHFNPKIIGYHEKVCLDTFNKCKAEFAQRGLNATDEDIIDLLAGRVPKNAIKLQRCEFCGKKISPKLYSAHLSQCSKKKNEGNLKQHDHQVDAKPKVDFKDNHNKLIELIKKQKREGSKNPSSSSNEPSE